MVNRSNRFIINKEDRLLFMEKYTKLLSSVSYFKNLGPADLVRIINSGQLKRYRRDKYIYSKEEPSAGMYVLFSGKVHLCNYNCDGQSQILSAIEPVTMFNEVTAIDGGPNPATAIAIRDCLTWNIGYEAFENLVKQYPDPVVGLAMMRVLAGRTPCETISGPCCRFSHDAGSGRTHERINNFVWRFNIQDCCISLRKIDP